MPWTRCAFLFAVLASLARSQDDAAAFVTKLDAALKAHPFFSKVDFTVEASRPPYRLYVQRPGKDDAEYVRKMLNTYVPFLEELRRLFVEDYAKPAGLEQSKEMPVFAIAILASSGAYGDYSNAVGNRALHMMRAHYEPALRLAVTYQDPFSPGATAAEERQAILHEFVHALQHAHSTTGAMPKPSWFNEGLAEYRCVCSNMPHTLKDVEEKMSHAETLAFVGARPAFRAMVAPVAELVAANSYKDVLDACGKRMGGAFQQQMALGVFYAQSESFVRFLHQGMEGKYKPGFLRYLAMVQKGNSGADVFAKALGDGKPVDLATVETEWLGWLTDRLRDKYGKKYPDLRKALGTGGPLVLTLAPPSAFDPSTLAWQPADAAERIAAARRLAGRGEYDAALQLLPPEAEMQGQPAAEAVMRERERMRGLIDLRDAILKDDEQKKYPITIRVDPTDVKGLTDVKGFIGGREDGAVVVGPKKTRVPLTALRPEWLLKNAQRQSRFEGAQRWLDPWVRWLNGQKVNSIKQQLQGADPKVASLRADLTFDLDAKYRAGALALVDLQRLTLPETLADAKQELERVRAQVRDAGASPLLQSRKAAVDQLVRALAERAFSMADPAVLPIRGQAEALSDGRIRVRYPGTNADAGSDFVLQKKAEDGLPEFKLTYDGPTQLTTGKDGMQLIGSGQLNWAVPLKGRQEFEFSFHVRSAVAFRLLVCADQENGMILVESDGTVLIYDRKTSIFDEVGEGANLYQGKTHKLKVVHDGEKQLEVLFDGKRTALVPNVGGRVRGNFGLVVHSSNAMTVKEVVVTGVPDPSDPTELRERYVTSVLGGLWP